MKTESEILKILKQVMWDYNIPSEELLLILKGELKNKAIDEYQLKARLLNNYSWYELSDTLGFDTLSKFLDEKTISYIWPGSLRDTYSNVRKLLL